MNLGRLQLEGELLFRRSPNRQLRTIGFWIGCDAPHLIYARGCRGSMQFSAGGSKGLAPGAAPVYLNEGSGGLEKVSIDAQFPYFRFQCLSGNAQLGGGAGWTADYALGFLECGLDHFSFALDKVGNQRNSRHS